MNRLPLISSAYKVCIICEGDEEYEYMDKLRSLGVWNEQYEITLVNAEGNGNIPARYQDKYQNGTFDLVLAFCDTDRKPYEQYFDIKRKINEFHGVDDAADKVLIYGNPCTMQIILEHWDEVHLESHQKKKNAAIIKKLTGVEHYNGHAEQRKKLFEGITVENYEEMRERIKQLPNDDTEVGSTNFGGFLDAFSDESAEWIDGINKAIE